MDEQQGKKIYIEYSCFSFRRDREREETDGRRNLAERAAFVSSRSFPLDHVVYDVAFSEINTLVRR